MGVGVPFRGLLPFGLDRLTRRLRSQAVVSVCGCDGWAFSRDEWIGRSIDRSIDRDRGMEQMHAKSACEECAREEARRRRSSSSDDERARRLRRWGGQLRKPCLHLPSQSPQSKMDARAGAPLPRKLGTENQSIRSNRSIRIPFDG